MLTNLENDLDIETKNPEINNLLAELAIINNAMQNMVDDQNQIFKLFTNRQYEEAGKNMAAMDRKYAVLTTAISTINIEISDIQRAHLESQRQDAEALKFIEYTLAAIIMFMIIIVVWYGKTLTRTIRSAHEKDKLASNILANSHEAILSIDNDQIIKQANIKASLLFGYQEDELLGKPINQLFSDNEIDEEIQQTLSSDESIKLALHQDSSEFYVDVNVVTTEFQHNTMHTYFISNINERIIAQKALLEANQALIESQKSLVATQKNEAIGKLAGGVAHEFNNLLTGIQGYAELIKSNVEHDSDIKNYTEVIIKTSARGSDLTSKILAFARKGQYQKTVCSLPSIIDDTLTFLKPTLSRSINIEYTNKAGDVFIMADVSQLTQALINLAINANHAMPDGGKLELSLEQVHIDTGEHPELPENHYALLRVCDTGCGIPIEVQQKVFDPFFTTKAVGEGTGLGLSMVQGTIKALNGHISVYSEQGNGTCFNIYLPIISSQPTNETATTQADTESSQRLKNKTILVVDDEEIIRDLAYNFLVAEGANCLVASNGKEAMTIVEQAGNQIDGVLLDIIMPVMDGLTALEQIRPKLPNAKFILASGYSENDNISTALKTHGAEFIQKPYHKEQLINTLAR